MFGTKFTVKEVAAVTAISTVIVGTVEAVKYVFRARAEKAQTDGETTKTRPQAVNN